MKNLLGRAPPATATPYYRRESALRLKLLIGPLTAACAILVLSFIMLLNTVQGVRRGEAGEHMLHILTRNAEVSSLLVEMETGVRGYLLTGDVVFLAPFLHGQERIDAELTELETLLATHPYPERGQGAAQELGEVVRQWMAEAALPQIIARQVYDRGLDDTTPPRYLSLVTSQHGKALIDQARLILSDITLKEQYYLSQGAITERSISHTTATLLELNRLELYVTDLESGVWGYALTGEFDFLSPYLSARLSQRVSLRHLSDLLADEPTQRDRLREVEGVIGQWVSDVGEPGVALRHAGGDVLPLVQAQRGRRLMDSLREQLMALKTETMTRFEQAQRGALQARRTQYLGVGLLAALALSALVLGSRYSLATSLFHIDALDRLASELAKLAYHDPLTGLPNRVLFKDRVNQALAQARRTHAQVTVMFIDLDGFKRVNDEAGHDVGDLLLKEVARRLADNSRGSDTVSRLAGDEFTILLPDISSPEDAERVATKFLSILAAPFEVAEQLFTISASIGVSLYPRDGESCDTLLKAADEAMYLAKQRGKNSHVFYVPA